MVLDGKLEYGTLKFHRELKNKKGVRTSKLEQTVVLLKATVFYIE